jgi:hypothetical protein
MGQTGLIHPARSLRSLVHGKIQLVPLPQRHNFRTRRHRRALLSQHKLAAGGISARLGQQYGKPNREYEHSVQILVQTIVIA